MHMAILLKEPYFLLRQNLSMAMLSAQGGPGISLCLYEHVGSGGWLTQTPYFCISYLHELCMKVLSEARKVC